MPATKTTTRARPRKPKPGKPNRRKPEVWRLRLFVAGQTPKSIRAFANLKVLCEKHLKGRYQIEVIDLLEHPHMARGNQIVALPDPGVQPSASCPADHWRPVQHRPGVGGPGAATGRLTRLRKVV